MAKMRILYLTSVDASGDIAPSVRVRNTCRALSNLGHVVTLVHVNPAGQTAALADYVERVFSVRWPSIRGGWKIFQFGAAYTLLKLVQKDRPDVIYVRSHLGWILELALKRAGVPIVLEVNGNGFLKDPRAGNAIKLCSRILVDNVVLKAKIEEEYRFAQGKVKKHNIFVTDSDHFRPIDRDLACTRLGLEKEALRLIHVSSFQDWHDFKTMISAAKLLSSKYNLKVELILVGDGYRRTEVKSFIEESKCGDIVRLAGRINHLDVPLFIGASDIALDILSKDLLVTGRSLSAVKVYEYMACARPVITAVDSYFSPPVWAKDLLSLVPPEDPEMLADAILRIEGSPEFWAEKSARAREYVRANRTWEAGAMHTLSKIVDVLPGYSSSTLD